MQAVILLLLLIGPGGEAQTVAARFTSMAACEATRARVPELVPDGTVYYAAACVPLLVRM